MSPLLDLSSPQLQPESETQLEPQEEAPAESYPKHTHTTGNAGKNPKAMSLPPVLSTAPPQAVKNRNKNFLEALSASKRIRHENPGTVQD